MTGVSGMNAFTAASVLGAAPRSSAVLRDRRTFETSRGQMGIQSEILVMHRVRDVENKRVVFDEDAAGRERVEDHFVERARRIREVLEHVEGHDSVEGAAPRLVPGIQDANPILEAVPA